MTPLSVVKSINKRIKAFYDYFGPNSVEYMDIKSIVYSYIGQTDFLLREYYDDEEGSMAVSRSKRAQKAYPYIASTIDELWEALKKYGTVKKHQRDYAYEITQDAFDFDSPAETATVVDYDDPEVQDMIRQASFEAYMDKYSDTDLYTIINEEILEQTRLPEDEKDNAYLDGLEYVFNIMHEKGKSVENKIARAWSYFNRIKLEHESYLKLKAEDGNGEYDKGAND